MDRLEHGRFPPHIGRAGQPNGPRHLRRHVGQDIAVEVERHHHIQAFRLGRHARRADVNNLVVGPQVGILGGHLVEDAMEQAVGELHDIVFGHAGDFFAAIGAGVLEGIADNALGAGTGNQFENLDDFIGLLVLDAGVQVFFVLADDDEVHARVGRCDVGRVRLAGSHVGEQTERLANSHIQAFVAAPLWGGDGAFEQHLVAANDIPRFGRDAGQNAAPVDSFSNFNGVIGEGNARRVEDAEGRGHDFRANAIAVGNDHALRSRHSLFSCIGAASRVTSGDGPGLTERLLLSSIVGCCRMSNLCYMFV